VYVKVYAILQPSLAIHTRHEERVGSPLAGLTLTLPGFSTSCVVDCVFMCVCVFREFRYKLIVRFIGITVIV
jgi:hypothetical protein